MSEPAGGPRVESLDVIRIRLRFRRTFTHHQKARKESFPTIVRLRLTDGAVGHGEALPRLYVTGETDESVQWRLTNTLRQAVIGRAFASLEVVRDWVQSAEAQQACEGAPAAFGGLELALLDAVGRSTNRPVSDVLGPVTRDELIYDGAVIGFLPLSVLPLYLGRLRDLGKRVIKIKVGRSEDADLLGQVRRTLGDDVKLVLDANGAWSAPEAIARIDALERFDIAAVEQPVPGPDFEGLAEVARAVSVPIIADESICTQGDARQLLEFDACKIWNLRVGKNGGLLATLSLAQLAKVHGIECRMGVLVGETGLLGAAGRLLAASVGHFRHLEFDESGNRMDDILLEPLTPVEANRVVLGPSAPGLAIDIDEERLAALALPPSGPSEPSADGSPSP